MGMPSGIGIIDTMIGFPHENMAETYALDRTEHADVSRLSRFGNASHAALSERLHTEVESLDEVIFGAQILDGFVGHCQGSGVIELESIITSRDHFHS